MSEIPMTTRRRGLAAAAAAIVIVALTLAPRGIVAPLRGAFMRAMDAAPAPLLALMTQGDPERVLNTLLFVPLGATVALLLGRRAWPLAMFAGLALSAAVEYAQSSIPGRVPDPADVLWNTVGAVIGVTLVTIPRLVAAAIRPQRGRVTST